MATMGYLRASQFGLRRLTHISRFSGALNIIVRVMAQCVKRINIGGNTGGTEERERANAQELPSLEKAAFVGT